MNRTTILTFLCICFSLWSLGNVLRFNGQGHLDGQEQGNPYFIENNEETFEFTISNGAGPIVTNHVYKTSDNSCGLVSVDHMTPGYTPATTWTIDVSSGNEIDLHSIVFDNIWTCFPDFHYDLKIRGYNEQTLVGEDSVTVDTIGVEFIASENLKGITRIEIECLSQGGLAAMGIQQIVWTSQVNPGPTLSVSRGGQDILNGDTNPSDEKSTKLSGRCGRFTMRNSGGRELILLGDPQKVTSNDTSLCKVIQQPDLSVLTDSASTSFVVEFVSGAPLGSRVTLEIRTNDCLQDLFSFVIEIGDEARCLAPNLEVFGRGAVISNGDSIAEVGDNTDFGATSSYLVKEFEISNESGIGDLTLTGNPVVALRDDQDGFEVVKQPSINTVAQGDRVTFAIAYDHEKAVSLTNEVIIYSDDTEASIYTFAIQVNAFPVEVYDFLSPDGDGHNDVFRIDNIESHQNHVTIIDQAGYEVFDTDSYQNDWDGSELPNGTYFYSVHLLDTNEKITGGLVIKR